MSAQHLKQPQKGVALVVVLTLFALAASLASVILYRQSHFQERTANLFEWDQRYQLALSVEAIAIQGLAMDRNQDEQDNLLSDSCQFEQWAVTLPPTPYDRALVSATVQDLQARFNLNWVVSSEGDQYVQNTDGIAMLIRLFESLLLQPQKAQMLAFQLADWADSNVIIDDIDGAEDESYEFSRTPNAPLAHESEVRALVAFEVEDVDDIFWQYVTALPIPSKININNAPPVVLEATLGFLANDGAVAAVLALRQEKSIDDLSEVLELNEFQELDEDKRKQIQERFGVTTEYFQVMTDVSIENQYTRLASRLIRPQNGQVSVYSRELQPRVTPLESACHPVYNNDDDNLSSDSINSLLTD